MHTSVLSLSLSLSLCVCVCVSSLKLERSLALTLCKETLLRVAAGVGICLINYHNFLYPGSSMV